MPLLPQTLRHRSSGVATSAREPFWKRPLVQFITAGVITLVMLTLVSGWLSKRAATEEAVADARKTTVLLGQSVAEPVIPRGLVDGRRAAIDKFDRVALHRLLVGDVLRIKIWDETGRIVYSDETRLIGDRFDFGGEELDVLKNGGSDAEVSDVSQPENRFEQRFGRLLEVYTQIWSPEGQPLLFEAYYSYDDVSRRSAEVLRAFIPITILGLLLFLALTGPLVWVLTRRLEAASAARERLLIAAVESSDAERRRIARDLHDGVVQDLAGISFTASATAREVADRPELESRLDAMGGRVRQTLRSLRSLLVEIYPPDLHTEGLAAALDDLVAPAAASGLRVTVDVADMKGVSDEATALLWRVAQEALRNATTHADASSVAIHVTRSDVHVALDVVDDGVGFDPEGVTQHGHLGLRAVRDLVAEYGGTLTVTSAPGQGTRVRFDVRSR